MGKMGARAVRWQGKGGKGGKAKTAKTTFATCANCSQDFAAGQDFGDNTCSQECLDEIHDAREKETVGKWYAWRQRRRSKERIPSS